MKTKLYLSEGCAPCDEVKKLAAEGRIEGEVEIVDVSTEEGFKEFFDAVLQHQDGQVPSAFRDGQHCDILLEQDETGPIIRFSCPSEVPETPAASAPDSSVPT